MQCALRFGYRTPSCAGEELPLGQRPISGLADLESSALCLAWALTTGTELEAVHSTGSLARKGRKAELEILRRPGKPLPMCVGSGQAVVPSGLRTSHLREMLEREEGRIQEAERSWLSRSHRQLPRELRKRKLRLNMWETAFSLSSVSSTVNSSLCTPFSNGPVLIYLTAIFIC